MLLEKEEQWDKQEEEAAKKEKEEAETRKKEEDILEKIIELEKSIAQEALNPAVVMEE